MKLTYFRGDTPNFGDEINAIMWPHLLPHGFLDEDDSELFLGAGSILWGHLPKAPRKFVAGSGYGANCRPGMASALFPVSVHRRRLPLLQSQRKALRYRHRQR